MAQANKTNKIAIAYILYDWASSPLAAIHTTFVFAVYFTSTVMPDGGSFLWSQMVAISAFIIAFLAPFLGVISDKYGIHKKLLLILTVISAIALAGLWFVKPDPTYALLALVLSAIVIISFELSYVSYNALLPQAATKNNLGKISGLAWGIGYVGAIACLIIVLVTLILPDSPPFGLDADAAEQIRITMPFVAIWLVVFSIPLFVFASRNEKNNVPFVQNFKESLQIARKTPTLLRFLIARMLYVDGVITLFAFGGVFAADVFNFSQTNILVFAIVLNLMAGIGAMLGGKIEDKIGNLKVIYFCLLAMIALGIIIVLTTNTMTFWLASSVLGLFVGPLQASSRSYIIRITPKKAEARIFSLTTLTGKATAFIGPLFYGWFILISGGERYGMLIVIILLALGLLLLPKPSKN